MDARPLTVQDVVALGNIVAAASQTAKIARLTDGGDVAYGHARRIGPKFGEAEAEDVRDRYLWVTLRSGMETWWPISELIAEANTGEFATYDWS